MDAQPNVFFKRWAQISMVVLVALLIVFGLYFYPLSGSATFGDHCDLQVLSEAQNL